MNIYLFGNKDSNLDNKPFQIIKRLKRDKNVKGISFQVINPNQDLPTDTEAHLVILDTVSGINETTLLDEKAISKLLLSPTVSVHDYDLGFQLKYLLKLKKIKSIKIIGIPQKGKIDYSRVHFILRKLVAQDIQGS